MLLDEDFQEGPRRAQCRSRAVDTEFDAQALTGMAEKSEEEGAIRNRVSRCVPGFVPELPDSARRARPVVFGSGLWLLAFLALRSVR
ncbi:hypothetical protein OG369_00235 [Streptomyces sp. NBC_01221]|uniref:hypothetical protein n=1 Tax=unclassified Streptomyces TaxID=2593676 RepID=UPI0022559803|nr:MULTISPECIES: hypothetical protein [unclassified Streptomyces]MCX4784691.1 hypothetical protein [Streptomyces sp. NBC_01221]WSJ40526.1 hypothetical protein OG772_34245 [Streptomyces sp. NBC_01321]